MNKQVYLYEFDSVRKTDKEVELAYYALYDELVNNDNIVVFSLNQITDSRAFLSILYNEQFRDFIIEQFKCGRIKFSRYGEFRTVAQYVLNTIEKNLDNSDNKFIYSAIPVKSYQNYMLSVMKRVIVNSDISLLQEYIDCFNNTNDYDSLNCEAKDMFSEFVGGSKEFDYSIECDSLIGKLHILKGYLRFILEISMSEVAANFSIEKNNNVKYYELVSIIADSNYQDIKELQAAKNYLNYIIERKNFKSMEIRSKWIDELYKIEKNNQNKKSLALAELILNLCYNYTVEQSIFGTSRHYEGEISAENQSFMNDFHNRLVKEWNNGKDYEEKYLKEENNEFLQCKYNEINWNKVGRILKRRKQIDFNKEVENKIKENEKFKINTYEYNFNLQRKKVKRRDIFYILKAVMSTLIYIAAIIIMDVIMSTFEESVSVVIKSSLTFIGLIIISGIIDKMTNLPDIIDCIEMFKFFFEDLFLIFRNKIYAYMNKDSNGKNCESSIERESLKWPLSISMKKYVEFKKEREELFIQSKEIPIVEPIDENLNVIKNFEIKNNTQIGVVYKSKFNTLLVDLVGENGQYYAYERLVPTVEKGAVVIVPIYKGKFVVLKQFRHAIRREQFCFPRGFGELKEDKNGYVLSAENAIKELVEEISANENVTLKYIGKITPDSGMSSICADVFATEINEYSVLARKEGIVGVELCTKEDILRKIHDNSIDDGYTISAIKLYEEKYIL